MTSFRELDLIEPLQGNVAAQGYETPTPIQAAAIPALLAGQDLMGVAQTGTGKTAAFSLPLIQHLQTVAGDAGPRGCRSLILTPTRELAVQISENITAYAAGLDLKQVLIYGGVGYPLQIAALKHGVDIVIATPGRLLDLINQGHARLWKVEYLVLDEADRMLDMGFIRDIREILACVPRKRQTAFFSATMAGQAKQLADQMLDNPVQITMAPSATPIELVEQQLVHVDPTDKRDLLGEMLREEGVERSLVFCRTKHGAGRLALQLGRMGIPALSIHGDKTQQARQRALDEFRDGRVRVLVATDVAARGLDIDAISHVFNFDMPTEPESYVHRIGRTGRAGAAGTAVSFCSSDERGKLRDIERLIRSRIPVLGEEPHEARTAEVERPPWQGDGQRRRRRRRRTASV